MLAGAVAAFALTNPFFFLDFDRALHQLRGQAELAGNQGKFGQEEETGVLYYLDSLLWGLGYVAAAASLAGAVLLARRDRVRAALLLVFPVALFLYLSFQSRFFGRWLLPAYPALALLAGYAVARAAEALRARAPRWEARRSRSRAPRSSGSRSPRTRARWPCSGSRTPGRSPASGWPTHHRRELRAVIEPAVPERFYWPVRDGRPQARAARSSSTTSCATPQEEHVEYGRRSSPRCSTATARRGYCTVVTMGLIRGRADARGNAGAVAYYDRLERESELVFHISPYRQDRAPQPFSFDLSYSYYSPAYERPGARRAVYRLDDCTQGHGPVGRDRPRDEALARRDPAGRAGAAAVEHRPRPAVRLQRRRGRALRPAGGADVGRTGLDPGYYENPPALTYLLARRLLPIGGIADPDAFLTGARGRRADRHARRGAHVLGRRARSSRRVGLVAAAVMAVAFLPVFYSKHALNDVVTLAPVTLALIGCAARLRARALDRLGARGRGDRRRDRDQVHGGRDAAHASRWPPALRVARDRAELRRALAGLVLAGAACAALFVLLNPFALLNFRELRGQIRGQSRQADAGKLGQDDVLGWIYYVGTLGWGFGWLPLAAAVGGAVVALRRDWRRALLLLAFPGLPLPLPRRAGPLLRPLAAARYPVLCVLAGYGVVAGDARAPRRAAVLVPRLAALLCAQGLLASVHVDRLLGRADTRAQALRWLGENVPAGARIVVEPFVPAPRRGALDRPMWPVERPFQAYEKRLRVRDIDAYRERGYCWVVVGSTQKQRGLKAGLRSSRSATTRRSTRRAPRP